MNKMMKIIMIVLIDLKQSSGVVMENYAQVLGTSLSYKIFTSKKYKKYSKTRSIT